jgi:hypothetical protein
VTVASALRVEIDPVESILEGSGCLRARSVTARRLRRGAGLARNQPVDAIAVGWERRLEADARPGGKDVRLFELEGDVPTRVVQESVSRLTRPAPLHLHAVGALPGRGIEEEDGAPFRRLRRIRGALDPRVDASGERLESGVLETARRGERIAEAIARVLVGGGQAGARQGVVELIEEDLLPGAAELFDRVGAAEREGSEGAPAFGRQEPVLGQAIQTLDLGMRGVAARCVML